MIRPCIIITVVLLAGCNREPPAGPPPTLPPAAQKERPSSTGQSLADARKGFTTKLARRESAKTPFDEPPPRIFQLVRFDAPAGKLGAYLSPDPADGKKHPAIVWITGGDNNTIDQGCWREGPPQNDQSAGQYRKAGIITMFPSQRGGNDNPGVREGFLGEIDDVIAAVDYLAKLSYVDPNRVYLGGHSTGGTVALLAAESTDRFRAVFSFGPVADPSGYGPEYTPFNIHDRREVELRSPIVWLGSIKSPTFVFEGAGQGNTDQLEAMRRASTNPKASFFAVKGGDHFNILAPINRLIAQKILADTGPTCNLSFSPTEVNELIR